jgi:hypothetical protein
VDRIAEDDTTVPPDFRGCDVVEVDSPEGTKVFFRGASGFSMSEDQAKILIQAYRIEQETVDREPPADAERHGKGRSSQAWEKPAPGDMVLRSLGYDAAVPEKLQGSRLIQRGEESFYLTLDGEAIPKEVGDSLLEAWELTGAHAVPPGGQQAPSADDEDDFEDDTVIDSSLKPIEAVEGGDEPRQTPSVEGAVWPGLEEEDEEPTVASRPSARLKPAEKNKPDPPARAKGPSSDGNGGQPTARSRPGDVVIETLSHALEMPEKLRGSILVEREGSFFFRTINDELIPKDVGETLMEAWEQEIAESEPLDSRPDEPTPEKAATPAPEKAEAPAPKKAATPAPKKAATPAPEKAATPAPEKAATPAPEKAATPAPKKTDGPPPAASQPKVEGPKASEVEAKEVSKEQLEDVRRLADLLRRDVATGVIKLDELAPSTSKMEERFWAAARGSTGQRHLDRLVGRSLDIRSHLLEAWEDSEDRSVQAWRKDLVAGTLVLPAINPVQAKDLDLMALVSLVRLRSDPKRLEKKARRLTDKLRSQILKEVKELLKPSSAVAEIVEATRKGLARGKPVEEAASEWFSTQLLAVLRHATRQASESEGLAVPHLAEGLLDSFTPLCRHLSFQLVD